MRAHVHAHPHACLRNAHARTRSVRIAEADLERVPELLAAVGEEQLASLQRNLSRVWHRRAGGMCVRMRPRV